MRRSLVVGLPGKMRENISCTIEFAKRQGTNTTQVPISHPGTKFYDWPAHNDLTTIGSVTDEAGHELRDIVYPGLDRAELVDWMERFYGEYYLWPCAVRKEIFDSAQRQRLAKEAHEYFALRAKRKTFVAEQHESTGRPAVGGK